MTGRRWEDALLDELRGTGDKQADDLADELLRRRPGHDEPDLVRTVLREVASRRCDHPGVVEWVHDRPALPPWFDPGRVALGQRFFRSYPLPITAALFCVSLPAAYAAEDGARALWFTSDLRGEGARRRFAETGQMMVDVLDLADDAPDTLEPGGRGYRTVRGVRLLHGVVRQSLRTTSVVPGGWLPRWGVPVNQEELLGTLLTFTSAVFHGLDRLGIRYGDEEADAYLHTWCVVGHLLGIRPDVLPLSRDDAATLADAVARRHHRRTHAGAVMMRALLREMELAMPIGMRKLPRALVRHMLPADILGVLPVPPAPPWNPAVIAFTRGAPAMARLGGRSRLLEAPAALVGRSIIRMYVDHQLGDDGPSFRADDAVRDRLGVGRSTRLRRRVRRARVVLRDHDTRTGR